MDDKTLYAWALALPAADYQTLQENGAQASEMMLTRNASSSVTNGRSRKPVIGTTDFNPCTVLLLYNARAGTAALAHEPSLQPRHLHSLLEKVRESAAEPVAVHVISAAMFDEPTPANLRVNQMLAADLSALLHAVDAGPQLELRTFDVCHKPKPVAVAIDSRSGRLLRGSGLYETYEEANAAALPRLEQFLADNMPDGQHFDGTTAEWRKATAREAVRWERGPQRR